MTAPQELVGRALRFDKFWSALLARLDIAAITGILNNPTPKKGLYQATDNFGEDDRSDGQPWGRLVAIAATTLWPAADLDSGYRGFGWVIRADMRIPHPESDPPLDSLGRLQQAVHDRLQGWQPTPADCGVVLRVPPYQWRGPDAMPDWSGDDARFWMLSSEWRAEASRP